MFNDDDWTTPSPQAPNADATCSSGLSPPDTSTSNRNSKAQQKRAKSNNSWCTPESVLSLVRKFFGGQIDLDPCSNEHATVRARTEYRLPTDGLVEPWFGKIFVNPPYGRDTERKTNLDHWVRRCVKAREQEGAEIIALLPASPETQRWHKHIFPTATAFCYPEGRIEFVEAPPQRQEFATDEGYDEALDQWTSPDNKKSSPPMACALVYWGDDLEGFRRNFAQLGKIFSLKDPASRAA